MNANQWFAKAAPSNLGEGVANLVADIAKAKWAELNKASVPGVSQVAGPNMLNDRMALSYITDIGYVGRSVFPMVTHEQIGGQYYEWDLDTLKAARLTLLGDGRAPDELDDKVAFKNFVCDLYGGRRSIGDLTRANAGRNVDVIRQAVGFLMMAAMGTIDRDFVDTCWKTGVWTHNVTPSTKWDASGATIDADIQKAVETLVNIWPNLADFVFVCSLPVWNAIMRSERFRGQGAAELPQAGAMRFREITGISRIVIGSAGMSKSEGFLGKNAAVFVAPMDKGLNDPSAGSRVVWTGVDESATDGVGTRTMRDELQYRTVVDVRISNAFVVQAPDLGYFFPNALT